MYIHEIKLKRQWINDTKNLKADPGPGIIVVGETSDDCNANETNIYSEKSIK